MEKQAYIIVFDTKSHKTQIVTALKAYGTWGRISENCYVIVTSSTATQIRDSLKNKAGASDMIFVIRSGAIAAWSNVPARNEWLKEHL